MDAGWAAEIARRVVELESGTVQSIPWAEVRQRSGLFGGEQFLVIPVLSPPRALAIDVFLPVRQGTPSGEPAAADEEGRVRCRVTP